MGPPVIFCDQNVGDLEAFEFIGSKPSEELGDVHEREGGADAGHDGGDELCGPMDELEACDGETKVSVGVIVVALFKVFDKGFEFSEEGVVGVILAFL